MNLLKSLERIGNLVLSRRWRLALHTTLKELRSRVAQENNSSFSFPILLQLEWILLGFIAITTTVTALFLSFPKLAAVTVLSVMVLGLMRLWLPTQRLTYKILYTGLEFVVLFLPTLLDPRIRPIPPLALVIVIRGCQMFNWTGRLITAGLTFISFSVLLLRSPPAQILLKAPAPGQSSNLAQSDLASLMMLLNANLSFGLALIFILLLINALLEEHRSRAKLASAHDQLRQYALRIENQSALQERNRIAREIHDSLGHTLTAQSIQLDSALLLLHSNVEQADLFLKESKQLCAQALREVRQSVTTLRDDPLQGKSLETAIATLIRDFHTTTNIPSEYTVRVTQPLSSEMIATTYRILQEALTNITRHSGATAVIIQIFDQDQKLYLLVRDNGRGFHPDQNSTGFGLQSMRERTAAMEGRFTLLSQPGAGCLITVQMPLPKLVL